MQGSEKASHDIWQHRDQPIIIIRGALLASRGLLELCESCPELPLCSPCKVDHDSCLLCRMILAALSAKQEAMQLKLSREQRSLASGAQRAAPGPLAASCSLTAAGRSRRQPSGASRACTGAARAAARRAGCPWAGAGAAGRTPRTPGQCPQSSAGQARLTGSRRSPLRRRTSLPHYGATGGPPAQRHWTSRCRRSALSARLCLAPPHRAPQQRKQARRQKERSPPYQSMHKQEISAAVSAARLSRSRKLSQDPSGLSSSGLRPMTQVPSPEQLQDL